MSSSTAGSAGSRRSPRTVNPVAAAATTAATLDGSIGSGGSKRSSKRQRVKPNYKDPEVDDGADNSEGGSRASKGSKGSAASKGSKGTRSSKRKSPVKSEPKPVEDDEDFQVDPNEAEEDEELQADEDSSRKRSRKTRSTSIDTDSNSRRVSSRANKFSGELKDPPSESVKDLFDGIKQKTGGKKRSSASSASSASVASAGVESTEESDFDTKKKKAPKKQKKSSPQRSRAASSRSAKKEVDARVPDSDEDFIDDSESESDGDESAAPKKKGGKRQSNEEEEDEDDDEMKMKRIIASRSETLAKWKEIGSKMNTSEVTEGSRWFQEEDKDADPEKIEERFLVLWNDLSFLHVSWETQEDLIDQIDNAKTALTMFFRKSFNGCLYTPDERCDGDYFDPGYQQIERILEIVSTNGESTVLAKDLSPDDEDDCKPEDLGIVTDKNDPGFEDGVGRQFFIKWVNMPYSEATYEFERDLIINEVEYKEPLKAFLVRASKPARNILRTDKDQGEAEMRRSYKIFGDNAKVNQKDLDQKIAAYQKQLEEHVYFNGGQLRDYQAEGISWMVSNYINNRSCILADEMGLGKTLQTAAFVNLLVHRLRRRGPYLVVVPLSTIAHWQREFVNWTGLNAIIYHGSAGDRQRARQYEFAYEEDRPQRSAPKQSYLKKCNGFPWMAQVVITTPEMLVTEDSMELAAINWEVLVVDEAHRLKNHNSKLAVNLRRPEFKFKHKLLLTGTPIQNDVKEFWTLLNFIDPKNYGNLETFLETYGEIKSKEKIDELHENIRPYILRRLKEDVEKSVPPKEETLIEVELTILQKQYYRALFEKNLKFLHKGKKKALDGPSLNNLAMQLRKVCNHLFLLNGVETELRKDQSKDLNFNEADFVVRGSGKLVLLDKLLPRLKENGHRILIFSQFKIMLDVLEDYLFLRKMKYERIDGSITGRKRQMAIDRYQQPTEGKEAPFVMLLSTRAGGVGINLTAADTCIIFDSDWNPQNDLQAQARCHRIGQTKNVQVYRLLSRKSYEMQMFHMSSMKMGLDQAVLKGFESGSSGEAAMSKEEVEKLLRHGAYDIFNEEKAGTAEAESNAFVEQDIDSILARRSRKVVHSNTGSESNAAGGTFSKASFKASKPSGEEGSKEAADEEVDIEDPNFWSKMVGDAPPEEVDEVLKPRKRKRANYSDKAYDRNLEAALSDKSDDNSGRKKSGPNEDVGSDFSMNDQSDSSDDDDIGADGEVRKTKKAERKLWGGSKATQWKRGEADNVLEAIEKYGYGNMDWDTFKQLLPQKSGSHSVDEVKRMSWAICLLAICEISRDEDASNERRNQRATEKKLEAEGKDPKSNPAESWSNQTEDIFSKHLDANGKWIRSAIIDAVDYASRSKPRAVGTSNQCHQEARLMDIFDQYLWPALKARGWVKEQSDGRTVHRFGQTTYLSPRNIINDIPRFHQELASMVVPVLDKIRTMRHDDSAESAAARAKHLKMSFQNINYRTLHDFLQRYAPLQLLADRTAPRKLFIGRRVLVACCCMEAAYVLFRRAHALSNGQSSTITESLQLLIPENVVNCRPIPSWNSRHDAALILAIATHGWIDKNNNHRAIINDTGIKWGSPFDDDSDKPDDKEAAKKAEAMEQVISDIKSTSKRALDFVNLHSDMLDKLKGCDRKRIIDSFGIRTRENVGNDDDSAASLYEIHDEALGKSTETFRESTIKENAKPEVIELPPKRDLGKRARHILLGSLAHRQNGIPRIISPKASESEPTEKPTHCHGYALVDLEDPVLVLLAEMLRGILKGSVSKNTKHIRMLCSVAFDEAHNCRKMFLGRSDDASKSRAQIMGKIAEQISLVKRSLQVLSKAAKNVLRVMLGMAPVPPRASSEVLFPTTELLQSMPSGASAAADEQEPSTKEESAHGDRALIRGLKKAQDRCKNGRCEFVDGDEEDTGIQLTMIETLILLTFCSDGLPDNASCEASTKTPEQEQKEEDYGYTWDDYGFVLDFSGKHYHSESVKKLKRLMKSMTKFESIADGHPTKVKAQNKLKSVKVEEVQKGNAAKQAADFAKDPMKLAKKTVMLLEKIRQFAAIPHTSQSKAPHKLDHNLGLKVQSWFAKELGKWGDDLDIAEEDGRPLSYTTKDVLDENPDFEHTGVVAILDKAACRNVIGQGALLAKIRQIFLRNNEAELKVKVDLAAKRCLKIGDIWERQPSWWMEHEFSENYSSPYEYLLLQRLAKDGMLNISDSTGMGPVPEVSDSDAEQSKLPTLKDIGLSKRNIQHRTNQIVREIHAMDESNEAIRMLKNRRDIAVKRSSEDKPLTTLKRTVASKTVSRSPGKGQNKSSGGIQTGIDSFFGKKSAGALSPVIDLPQGE